VPVEPDSAERFVAAILESMGFEVFRIPETNEKTPDLRAERGDELFLVEVKLKQDGAEREPEMLRAFSADDLYQESHPLGPRNRIAAIVREASTQLEAYDPGKAAFRLLWVLATGPNAEAYVEQFRSTLYGLTELMDLQEPAFRRRAFYFHHSAFHRERRRLDGVVLATVRAGELCINRFSENAARLRSTTLATVFGRAVFDPADAEASGAIVLDLAVCAGSLRAALRHAQEKLGRTTLVNLDMRSHSVWGGLKVG